MAHLKPTVIFVAYGMNESFEGEKGLPNFQRGLATIARHALGADRPRIVLISPMRHEDLGRPLPDPAEHNRQLALYVAAFSIRSDHAAAIRFCRSVLARWEIGARQIRRRSDARWRSSHAVRLLACRRRPRAGPRLSAAHLAGELGADGKISSRRRYADQCRAKADGTLTFDVARCHAADGRLPPGEVARMTAPSSAALPGLSEC